MNPFGADPLSVAAPPRIEPTEYPKQKAWSISAVRSHATCPQKFKFIRIDRLPEPEQPGGPLDRGKQVHAWFAHYIMHGRWPEEAVVTPVLEKWAERLDPLHACGARAEEQIAFTKDWKQCEWYAPDVRARFVFDVVLEPTHDNDWIVAVIDWKTGRRYESHAMDARLYALAAMKMFPKARTVNVNFRYVDEVPSAKSLLYMCERSAEKELEKYADLFNNEFLNDTIYPARPGPHCRWCYQRKSAGGLCAFG
jgi:CRISPR/Cas system-associated exonuclease Cas4 (RecB family)